MAQKMACCEESQREDREPVVTDVLEHPSSGGSVKVSFTLRCAHCNQVVAKVQNVSGRELRRRQASATTTPTPTT